MQPTSQLKAAAILLILHITTTRTAKNSAPSVHEVINEQARIDDKRPLYGNPLAGNSQQNAKLHAQHQQAMFNAERVRQHRAQLQRWNKAPQQMDSYMKAYHESQENHQLALEQMQSTQKDKKPKARQDRTNLRSRSNLDPIKITRADAVDKNRNHRSFGSVYNYNNALQKYKINTAPGPTYDQGVTIKPNGNVGLNSFEKEHTGLYTAISPSKTQYVYPKLYNQMHSYQSAEDIHALNTLLTKSPQEQITELNTLTQPKEYGKDVLQTPIDLYFYLNNPNTAEDSSKYNVQNAYVAPYATGYANYEDHKPITEEVDDIDEEKAAELQKYQQPAPTPIPHVYEDPTTTKSNYYKIEVEQTISGNKHGKNIEYVPQHKPNYAALKYEKPLNFYTPEPSTEGVKYLQPQVSGVQHLSQDGTGVSAYGDDDVSKTKVRIKRQLDTELFILGNDTTTQEPVLDNEIEFNENNTTSKESFENSVVTNNIVIDSDNKTIVNATDRNETLPKADEWKRYRTFNDDQPAGVARDYDYYDEDNSRDYSYEGDYDPDDDFSSPNIDYSTHNHFKPPTAFTNPNRQRKPAYNQNIDTQSAFSNRYTRFKHPSYNDFHSEVSEEYGPPSPSYGPPSTSYGYPSTQYGPPKYNFRGPKQHYGSPTQFPEVSSLLDSLEPVYMLTESQLKDIVGPRHVNVQHLDVFQYTPLTKPKHRYPRKNKKHRPRRRPRKLNLAKFRKLNKSIQYAANYEFGYRVRDHETGNDFGHQEAKSGDKTRGSYHVLLPDGRLQQVKYSAGPDGFHADISYDHLHGNA
ncbi:hypothetical protein B5X24_HaOG205612 [Helicoverpa armigera]|uniref:Cuticle protein n=1 Tax=Helicoverpa armigera TaxID=29058 RepID=A0A2W1BLP3_HELAM|nr:hypothetical protein B5X24_HaOG205612 [Helicoverpa armigera]